MALQADLRTLKTVISSLSGDFSHSSRTFAHLQTLYKTILKIETILRDPVFARRQDAERIRGGIGELVRKTMGNMQDFQEALLATNSARLHDAHSELKRHTIGFQHAIDVIEGRNSLPKPSPKASRAPSASPDPTVSSSRVAHPPSSTLLAVDDPSTGKISISTPASPYQPTVEEVPDSSDEDEIHNVHAYYLSPSEIPEPIPPPSSSSLKDARRQRVLQTPPQVVVRSATDDFPAELPRIHAEIAASPLRASMDADSAEPLTSSVTKIPQKEQNKDAYLREIKRLEAEVQHLQTSRQSSNEGKVHRSPHHQSLDLGHVDDYPNPQPHHDQNRRQRASTTNGMERPKSYIQRSSPEGRTPGERRSPRDLGESLPLKRTPSGRSGMLPPSPRYAARSPRVPRSPQSAVEPRFDDYWSAYGTDQSQLASEMFGADPRASLPTVLETSMRRPTTDRTGRRSKRTSAYFDDPGVLFQDFFQQGDGSGADFSLFDSAPPPESRKRAASKVNVPSPGSLTPLPRDQTTEDLEPMVKELAVTLEDLFYGVNRRIKMRRLRYNSQARDYLEEECILDVPIYKGLKPGSKVKFQEGGDETVYGRKDIHFVLVETPHAIFSRRDYDLYCTVEIPLADSLCGWQRSIQSICGKTVVISHDGPTPPHWKECFAGLGMCKYKRPDQRGDLIVEVSIKYPGVLSERQKMMLRNAFANA